MSVMERLELIFESEEMFNAELVRETLGGLDLHYKSMKRIAIEPPKAPKKCCGKGRKKQVIIESPKLNLKDKLMAWSYKNISECLFCAGMRLGLYVGILLTGLFVLYIGG
jgi:hypothetical protein